MVRNIGHIKIIEVFIFVMRTHNMFNDELNYPGNANEIRLPDDVYILPNSNSDKRNKCGYTCDFFLRFLCRTVYLFSNNILIHAMQQKPLSSLSTKIQIDEGKLNVLTQYYATNPCPML